MPESPHNHPPTDNLVASGKAERKTTLCQCEALRPRLQHRVTLALPASPTSPSAQPCKSTLWVIEGLTGCIPTITFGPDIEIAGVVLGAILGTTRLESRMTPSNGKPSPK